MTVHETLGFLASPSSEVFFGQRLMATVAIIGAGTLGGALAHKLAACDCLDQIRLIDPSGDVAAGKALDILQAGPIEGFHTLLSGTADLWAAAGSTVIVLADPAGTPAAAWQGEAGLAMLKRVADLDPRACIVCAGAEQRRLVATGVTELRIPRARLIGSAPGALTAAVRALVALDTASAASDVTLTVAGVPPAHAVVSWNAASVHGVPITSVLSPPALSRLAARVPFLWPPGPYALASAAAAVCEAIARADDRRTFSCFVSLDGELGARDVAAAMPVRLGPGGVERVLELALSAQERVSMENAIARF